MPDARRYPLAAAESVRSLLMIRLGLHLGLRQKNLRQMLVCPKGQAPRTERELERLKCGELRWSERDSGWEVFVPCAAFKNAGSAYFSKRPFRLVLPDLGDLYRWLDAYIETHRPVLLAGASDPGTVFVKTRKRTSTDAAYNQKHLLRGVASDHTALWNTESVHRPWGNRGPVATWPAQRSGRPRHPRPEDNRILRAGELRHSGHTGDGPGSLWALPPPG